MNNQYLVQFKHKFAPRFAAFSIAIFFVGAAMTAQANEPGTQIICEASIDLHCAAEDMRDEIKTHFRGTKCYVKMLAVNIRIKTRSAAVTRRIKRNPCYNGLDRDLARLNEWVRELNELYECAMKLNSLGQGRRCVVGETVHVAEKLAVMWEIADCMKAASLGLVSQVEAIEYSQPQPTMIIIPEYDPNLDAAPSVSSVIETEMRLDNDQGSTLRSQTPTLAAPLPSVHSVLER